MQIRPKCENKFKFLLEQSNNCLSVKDNTVHFDDLFMYDNIVDSMVALVDFGPQLVKTKWRHILNRSILKTKKSNDDLDAEKVIRIGNQMKVKYLRQVPLRQYMHSWLSLTPPKTLSSIRQGNCYIKFNSKDSKQLDYGQLTNTIRHTFRKEHLPTDWCTVRVGCRARCPLEAIEICQSTLNIARARWNLIVNPLWSTGSGRQFIFNRIVSGPLYTIHKPNGDLEGNQFWYEPDYRDEIKAYKPSSDWEKIEAQRQWFAGRLKKMSANYRSLILEALESYVLSLDSHDATTCYLGLWKTLELLSGIKGNTKHDDVVRRSSFIWDRPELHEEILNHCKLRRNAIVHHVARPTHYDGGTDSRPINLYYLKLCVEQMLRFHHQYAPKFIDFHRTLDFLDMPRDFKVIDDFQKMYRELKKFRKQN